MRFGFTVVCLFTVAVMRSEVIDRVAVSVQNSVIAESEVLRQIRLTSLFNDEPVVFTAARKRETAERLVEQMLIRREIASTRYLPEDPEAYRGTYDALRKRIGGEEPYRQKLEKYGVSDADVRDALHWQTTLLEFIQVRFRPGIQVPDQDIRDYYDLEIATKANAPPFEQVRDEIENLLTEQRVNAALDRWLGQTRTQTEIRYRDEVLQ